MNYTKPEVVKLGDAAELIENSSLKSGKAHDNLGNKAVTPAYDLDE